MARKPLLLSISFRLERLRQAGRRFWLRQLGIWVGAKAVIHRGVDCRLGLAQGQRGHLHIGRASQVEVGVVLHSYGGSIHLENHVFLGPYVVIYGHGGVHIGPHTLVAMHSRIVSSNHTVPDPGTAIRSQPDIPLPTRIGADVWIGAGVTILGGVTIGDGCVIGAGAVVAKDIPAYSYAVGVPARVVKRRGELPRSADAIAPKSNLYPSQTSLLPTVNASKP
ncbi:acyltransferase [Leptolyngbya sp. CCNP1308]|uniref:acyltransferase n=1 Tax=Leptolyngbya sp. CCNP1308 TaxID=3110255 RepID=UPI002B20D167|nr:acyltransferase [Leptolyngbya sp. CCNP1308]MEA5452425.1 acyltransferase [Leptolyngbya sp. CCNP1308]